MLGYNSYSSLTHYKAMEWNYNPKNYKRMNKKKWSYLARLPSH